MKQPSKLFMLFALDTTSRILGCCLSVSDSENSLRHAFGCRWFWGKYSQEAEWRTKSRRPKGKKSPERLLLGWLPQWATGLSCSGISHRNGRDMPCHIQSRGQEADISRWFLTSLVERPQGYLLQGCAPGQSFFLWLRKKSCSWKAESRWDTHLHGLRTVHCSYTELKWIEGYGSSSRSGSKESSWQWQPSWQKRTQTPHPLRGYRMGQTFHSVRFW